MTLPLRLRIPVLSFRAPVRTRNSPSSQSDSIYSCWNQWSAFHDIGVCSHLRIPPVWISGMHENVVTWFLKFQKDVPRSTAVATLLDCHLVVHLAFARAIASFRRKASLAPTLRGMVTSISDGKQRRSTSIDLWRDIGLTVAVIKSTTWGWENPCMQRTVLYPRLLLCFKKLHRYLPFSTVHEQYSTHWIRVSRGVHFFDKLSQSLGVAHSHTLCFVFDWWKRSAHQDWHKYLIKPSAHIRIVFLSLTLNMVITNVVVYSINSLKLLNRFSWPGWHYSLNLILFYTILILLDCTRYYRV